MSDSTNRHLSEPAGAPAGARTDGPPSGGESEAIARLLRLAGPRPAAPRDAAGRVRSATRGAWREGLREARGRRFVWAGVGLAAASLAAVLLTAPRPAPAPAATAVGVATLGAATGHVTRTAPGQSERRTLRFGETLLAGDRVETGPESRVALDLTGGASLRLDRETRLLLLRPGAVLLERGGVYFDSADGGAGAAPIEVHTEFGVVRHVGTQFEARRHATASGGGSAGLEEPDTRLTVRVRQGIVHLDNEGTTHEAGAGVELRVSGRGELSRHPTPLFGPSWDWILDVAPAFSLEGHTLEEFLAWVSRETGWLTRFPDPSVAAASSSVVLHGSIAGFRPDRALDTVLPTCGLEHRFEGGILLIEAEAR